MTTIITYRTNDKVYMMTDTESTLSDTIRIFKSQKLYKHKDLLIAITGNLSLGFRSYMNLPSYYDENQKDILKTLESLANESKERQDLFDTHVSFVVCSKTHTYYISNGGYCIQKEDFFAIGSGCEIAYGAYDMLEWELDRKTKTLDSLVDGEITWELERIMKICMKRNLGTGGEIDCMELEVN